MVGALFVRARTHPRTTRRARLTTDVRHHLWDGDSEAITQALKKPALSFLVPCMGEHPLHHTAHSAKINRHRHHRAAAAAAAAAAVHLLFRRDSLLA